MVREIRFDSDTVPRKDGRTDVPTELRVWVDITCTDPSGAGVIYRIRTDMQRAEDDMDLLLDMLPPTELVKLDHAAAVAARDHAQEAYAEYKEFMADASYDRWKDEQAERGE